MDQPNLAFQKEKHLFITQGWRAKFGISAYNPAPFSPFKTPLVGGCDRVTQPTRRRRRGAGMTEGWNAQPMGFPWTKEKN